MSSYSKSEETMWADLAPEPTRPPTDDDINQKYAKRELRIITETNREQLPNFVAALRRPDWMNLQPFYQRRLRWDDARKSKLIESFIMNIPVPPCFLYESEFARYEVMDGQQRISAIWEFYDNKFKLKNLEQWPELNGCIYDKLPSEIKKGLDRRSISYTVLLKESAKSKDEEVLLRQQVFERLNTGGVALENQEIRHCIYHSSFDDLLFELARHSVMRRAFGLIPYSKEEDINPPHVLLGNPHYSKMRDVEFVLRTFTLRHATHYRGGMQSFFDQYMVRSRRFNSDDIKQLREVFVTTIELADEIYGPHLFRPWNRKTSDWSAKPQIAYADAIMVGISDRLQIATELRNAKAKIVEGTKQMTLASDPKTFTGQRNTKADVMNRITAYKNMLDAVLQ